MWEKVLLPYFFERMVAFSQPVDDLVAVISDEGIHLVSTLNPAHIITDETQPEGGDAYDETRQLLRHGDRVFHMLGLHGGIPRLESSFGERIELDQHRMLLKIQNRTGASLDVAYNDLSGDWAYATFTPDDRHVLLGLPYELHIFRR